jgi:pseudouridine-5'-phosphate glycosidase
MFKIHPEVMRAIKKKMPIVALESTIIAHGMPYPKNVETAIACEKIIRDNGAIPATIAIIKGEITVGLSIAEIEYIGQEGLNVYKASRRDLPYVIMNKLDGALTVAGTMMIASN